MIKNNEKRLIENVKIDVYKFNQKNKSVIYNVP